MKEFLKIIFCLNFIFATSILPAQDENTTAHESSWANIIDSLSIRSTGHSIQRFGRSLDNNERGNAIMYAQYDLLDNFVSIYYPYELTKIYFENRETIYSNYDSIVNNSELLSSEQDNRARHLKISVAGDIDNQALVNEILQHTNNENINSGSTEFMRHFKASGASTIGRGREADYQERNQSFELALIDLFENFFDQSGISRPTNLNLEDTDNILSNSNRYLTNLTILNEIDDDNSRNFSITVQGNVNIDLFVSDYQLANFENQNFYITNNNYSSMINSIDLENNELLANIERAETEERMNSEFYVLNNTRYQIDRNKYDYLTLPANQIYGEACNDLGSIREDTSSSGVMLLALVVAGAAALDGSLDELDRGLNRSAGGSLPSDQRLWSEDQDTLLSRAQSSTQDAGGNVFHFIGFDGDEIVGQAYDCNVMTMIELDEERIHREAETRRIQEEQARRRQEQARQAEIRRQEQMSPRQRRITNTRQVSCNTMIDGLNANEARMYINYPFHEPLRLVDYVNEIDVSFDTPRVRFSATNDRWNGCTATMSMEDAATLNIGQRVDLFCSSWSESLGSADFEGCKFTNELLED